MEKNKVEKDEMEKDANFLKQSSANYLESLTDALRENESDADELGRIYLQIQSYRVVIQSVESKVGEHLSFLKNLNTKKNEIEDTLGKAVRELK